MIVYIKSKEEVDGFIEAGKIAGKILKKLIESVEIGITTLNLDEISREEFKKHNAIPTFLGHENYPATICASVNNCLVHGIPNKRKLKDGDLITIDVGATIDGCIGDTAETIGVGNFTINQELISKCREALTSAIDVAKSGNKLSRIAEVISKTSKFSIPKEYGGHGINRNQLHADPYVSNIPDYENDILLRKGMIIAIEPMFIDGSDIVYSKGWDIVATGKTAHCEHTILIDEEPVILTKRENEDIVNNF